MSDPDRVTSGDLLAALRDPTLTIVTLPSRASCPPPLTEAVTKFEPTSRPAATASGEWLRDRALIEHGSARTYVWVSDGRVHAFFALSVGTCRLKPEQLVMLEAGPRPMPAVLLAQAARARDSDVAPREILETAIGVAEEIASLGGAGALMLDPYDPATERMWRKRGFLPTSDKPRQGAQQRLWIELGTS